MKIRVLIVNSIDDSITQERIESLDKSPQTERFEIFHAFASRDLENKITLNELLFRIKLPIKSFNPEYVAFHTGAAFYQQPQIFQKCVVRLKKEYPNIKFTYEPNLGNEVERYFDKLTEFDKSKEAAEVVHSLFFKIFNRIKIDRLWIYQQL